jgi:hypothetical protein
MKEEVLFEEKQHLGYNRQSMTRRTVLAIFCFLAYFWSENPKSVEVSGVHIGSYPVQGIENSGLLFFIMGISILMFSLLFPYLVHLHTVVRSSGVTLTGLWTSRKVNIGFGDIVSVRKLRFSRPIKGHSVYNLHGKGKIRFHTRGNDMVELTDKSGLKYRIGTQHAAEFLDVVQKMLPPV